MESFLRNCGVEIGGDRPWDVRVLDESFYSEIVRRGIDGALDGYVDEHWDTEQLDVLTDKVLGGRRQLRRSSAIGHFAQQHLAALWNRQTRRRSLVVRRHYDIGEDLFSAMLDSRRMYSCGYWREAENLEDAQEAKLRLCCEKVGLAPGMRVLDIGCGWGGFAKYAAESYGAEVVGVTLSRNQHAYAEKLCKDLPVEIRIQDYRDIRDKGFDAIVSIGMFEHVGPKNYRRFFDVTRRLLDPEGLMLLHTIGSNRSTASITPWINRNIFPGANVPSPPQITQACQGLFIIEDWHNFGTDYDKTLMVWFERFRDSWPDLADHYDARFYRIWKCYLLACAGSFRARANQLLQIVLSPTGVRGGYTSIR